MPDDPLTQLSDRFWSKVDKNGPVSEHAPHLGQCWLWTASTYGRRAPYGRFSTQPGMTQLAHRIAYELAIGSIPEGLQIDHLCRVKLCVNPAHMEPVTNTENHRRLRITHCRSGHELTPENLIVDPGGGRHCRTCRLAYGRDYWARKVEATVPCPDCGRLFKSTLGVRTHQGMWHV